MSIKNLDKFSTHVSNVVRPKAFQRTTHLDEVRVIHEYWEGLCSDASIPYRRDIDARALGAQIGSCMILDRISDDNATIRLAGHMIQRLVGFEITNLPLTVLFSQVGKTDLREMVKSMFDDRVPQFLDVTSERRFLKPGLTARMVFLPLLDMTGACSQALGVVSLTGSAKRPPYRFDITTVRAGQDPTTAMSQEHLGSHREHAKGAYLKVVK